MPSVPSRSQIQIQPGDLKRPLTFYTRKDPQTKTGGSAPTYTPVFARPVWAMDKYKNAKALDQAGTLVTTSWHIYTVRYNPAIVEGLYLSDPNYKQKMFVQGVGDPDGTRHWMELTVTDVGG